MPILDRSNYGLWLKAMKAFLMSIGLWGHANGDIASPAPVADGTPHTNLPEWTKHDQQALGSIMLCITPSIQQDLATFNDAKDVWNHLETTYGTATPISIYKDFKEALNMHINPSQHPGPQMDKMQACFQCLTSNSIIIPDQIKVMMLLATIPQKWETLVTIVMQSKMPTTLTFSRVRKAILAQHEGESTRGKGSNNKQHTNKLSTVKWKCSDPNFSNQQKGNQQQEQTGDKPHQCGQHSKGKGKKKCYGFDPVAPASSHDFDP
jgi:hypothetical protein